MRKCKAAQQGGCLDESIESWRAVGNEELAPTAKKRLHHPKVGPAAHCRAATKVSFSPLFHPLKSLFSFPLQIFITAHLKRKKSVPGNMIVLPTRSAPPVHGSSGLYGGSELGPLNCSFSLCFWQEMCSQWYVLVFMERKKQRCMWWFFFAPTNLPYHFLFLSLQR